jgi:hypothetical protein
VFLRGALHRRHGGDWTGTVRIPRWLGQQVLQFSLVAEFGPNYRPTVADYSSQRLSRLHFPTKLTVVSGTDDTRPAVTSVSFSPKSIDSTNGPEHVTVTAHATDTGSGVKYLEVSSGIQNGANGSTAGDYPFPGVGYLSSDDFHARLHKSAGNTWVGTTTIRQCVPSGTYKLNVDARDAAGNSHYYSTKQLAKHHITSTVQVTSKHGDTVAPYVYSAATYGADSEVFLNFSEGVATVDTSTLTLYPMAPRKSRFTKPAPIAGIVCANGRTTVACSGSAGLVTSAVLTVPSLVPGHQYELYANLDDTTPQLTDGNANPMDWNNNAVEVKDS